MRRLLCIVLALSLSLSGAHACEHGAAAAETADHEAAAADPADCHGGAEMAGHQGMATNDDGGFCNGDCNGCTLAAAVIIGGPITPKLQLAHMIVTPGEALDRGRDVALDPPPPRA